MTTCEKVLVHLAKAHAFVFEEIGDGTTVNIFAYINENIPGEASILPFTGKTEADKYYQELLNLGFVEGSLADIEKIKTQQCTNASTQEPNRSREHNEQKPTEKFYDERLRHLEGWVRYLVETRYTGTPGFNFDFPPPEPLPRPDSWNQPVEQAIPTKQPTPRLSRGRGADVSASTQEAGPQKEEFIEQ